MHERSPTGSFGAVVVVGPRSLPGHGRVALAGHARHNETTVNATARTAFGGNDETLGVGRLGGSLSIVLLRKRPWSQGKFGTMPGSTVVDGRGMPPGKGRGARALQIASATRSAPESTQSQNRRDALSGLGP